MKQSRTTKFIGLTAIALCFSMMAQPVQKAFAKAPPASAAAAIQQALKDPAAKIWDGAPFIGYTVPAFSAVKRLASTVPPDGTISRDIRILTTPGQTSESSFVLAATQNVKQLKIDVSDLKSETGKTLPASAVDLRVVKIWYQAGTGWHSYFADPTAKVLVPELLLHDETLVKVDTVHQEDFVRASDGGQEKYFWISDPPQVWGKKFDWTKHAIKDAPTLQPVELTKGFTKQFWITLHTPEKIDAGIYRGALKMIADGKPAVQFDISVRVLPFDLPRAKTYYDLNKDFLAIIYARPSISAYLSRFNGNWDLAEKQVDAEVRDIREHNIWNGGEIGGPKFDENDNITPESRKEFVRSLEIYKKYNYQKPYVGIALPAWEYRTAFAAKLPKGKTYEDYLAGFRKRAQQELDIVKEVTGLEPGDVYFWGYDEAGLTVTRRMAESTWKIVHELGANVYQTSKANHFVVGGYAENVANRPGNPAGNRDATFRLHTVGARMLMYASPHTGPENPDFNRRYNGMLLYKNNYDGTGNYKYHEGGWDDFHSGTYRSFNLVYPVQGGVIDTMAWQGYRAGLDDIRYATKLKMLAKEAIDTKDPALVDQAKQDLAWLELSDAENDDLNMMRTEMVNRILKLQSALKGAK